MLVNSQLAMGDSGMIMDLKLEHIEFLGLFSKEKSLKDYWSVTDVTTVFA